MADLKSIVCIDQAQAAPATIPDNALVLIEINRQVFKTTYGELAGGGGTLPDGAVTNAKVAADAAIALSKLANVAAGTSGLAAGSLQDTLQALATRIAALETP